MAEEAEANDEISQDFKLLKKLKKGKVTQLYFPDLNVYDDIIQQT